jgi:transcriptional regulator with XRE-family HTH domain
LHNIEVKYDIRGVNNIMNERKINIKKFLGRRVREERLKLGWTIEQLAENVELSPSFLGCVERGERALSIEKIYRISETFNVTIDSLIKENLPYNSKAESVLLLIKDLDENQYHSVYEIAKTATEHFKGK